jgi:hypothetical protein
MKRPMPAPALSAANASRSSPRPPGFLGKASPILPGDNSGGNHRRALANRARHKRDTFWRARRQWRTKLRRRDTSRRPPTSSGGGTARCGPAVLLGSEPRGSPAGTSPQARKRPRSDTGSRRPRSPSPNAPASGRPHLGLGPRRSGPSSSGLSRLLSRLRFGNARGIGFSRIVSRWASRTRASPGRVFNSEEKHEPASDIGTAVVDSLKVLDPKRPIRERMSSVRVAIPVDASPLPPSVTRTACSSRGTSWWRW